MATQNPIESEGTYPLPEAQVDRFMLKVLVGYPEHDEELTVVQRSLVAAAGAAAGAELERLRELQAARPPSTSIRAIVSYAVQLADSDAGARGATGSPTWRRSSPTARARAGRSASSSRRGRSRSCAAATTCVAQDVDELAKDALRHRLVLSYQALAEQVDADVILDAVLAKVPAPRARPRAGGRPRLDGRRAGRGAPPARPTGRGRARCRRRCCARSS